jgi:hypothetical protein
MNSERRIEPEQPVRATERRVATFQLPDAVSKRLDDLTKLVHDEGGRTSRQELVAALIGTAPADGPTLIDALRSYRMMSVRDVTIGSEQDEVVVVERYGPGPRRHN